MNVNTSMDYDKRNMNKGRHENLIQIMSLGSFFVLLICSKWPRMGKKQLTFEIV